MAVSFSSSDEDVIHRKIQDDLKKQNIFDYTVDEFFEIQKCCEWILTNNFSKVALQFPDSLLTYSAEVSITLQKSTSSQIFILGDTSYGSCCVDEVTAEHVSADAIIHFGHACLSPTNRLPVLYIFGKKPINIKNTVNAFATLFVDRESNVIVFYEVFYSYAQSELSEKLKSLYKNIVFSQYCIPQEKNATSFINEAKDTKSDVLKIEKSGRIFEIPHSHSVTDYNMFYIGSESQTLMNLMLNFSHCKFFTYDPLTNIARQETLDVNKYLRKRYYYIERAKDAKIIGILVGTLGVKNYLSVINRLRSVIKEAGKKSYTVVVGKLNSAKLANFSEIEIFVYVACPESSIIDTHEFYQPIVTPFEMEVACNASRHWTGDYVTDFNELLPGSAHYVQLNTSSTVENDVSLVTGKIRSLGRVETTESESISSSELTLRDKMVVSGIHSDSAGEHLLNRSWRGLEQKLGETPVAEVVQGQKGVAAGYENEGQES